MASELTVQTIKGPTSGANANKVIIPSGHTLDASGGTLVPSAGQVVQVVKMTPTNSALSTTSSTFTRTNLALSITPKFANSLIKIELTACFLNQGGELQAQLYKDQVVSNLLPETQIHGDYDGNGQYASYSQIYYHSPNTTNTTEYALYVRRNGSTGTCYVYRAQYMLLTEIAQ